MGRRQSLSPQHLISDVSLQNCEKRCFSASVCGVPSQQPRWTGTETHRTEDTCRLSGPCREGCGPCSTGHRTCAGCPPPACGLSHGPGAPLVPEKAGEGTPTSAGHLRCRRGPALPPGCVQGRSGVGATGPPRAPPAVPREHLARGLEIMGCGPARSAPPNDSDRTFRGPTAFVYKVAPHPWRTQFS